MPLSVRSTTRVRRTEAVAARPRPVGRRAPAGTEVFRTELSGFEEVPPILTQGTGSFRAQVARGGNSISYELTFSNLTAPSTVAHIHIGQRGVAGPVAVFLCGGGSKPDCPGVGGTISGTILPEDVLAVPEQGLAAGDMAGLLRFMRAGVTYVNVHSTTFPAGEIRGQLRRVRR